MAEGSESSSGGKRQLGTIYRERNLGKLATEESAHDAEIAEENISKDSQEDSRDSRPKRQLGRLLSTERNEENISKGVDQVNSSKTSEGDDRSSKSRRQLGKLLSPDETEENVDKSVDQANLSKTIEGESSTKPPQKPSRRFRNTMKTKTKTDRGEATSKRSTETVVVLFDEESGFLQRFNPRNSSLTKMHEMMSERKHDGFSSVILDDFIYVLRVQRLVYRLKYSDKTATWEKMPDMIEYHGWWPPAVAYSKSIYVLGGSGLYYSCFVEKYDSVSNKWVMLKDKPQSTKDSGVFASRGYIYCFGGISEDGGFEKSVQRFHLESILWEDLPPMNKGKARLGVTEFRGKIYVMGGGAIRQTSERYDPATQQWTMLRPTRISRERRFRCFAIDGFIYAVGGDRDSPSNTLEKYDVKKDEWEMVDLACQNKVIILDSAFISLHN